MRIKILTVVILALGLAGCATARKETRATQLQQLQAEVERLKSELQQKNERVDALEWQLAEQRGKVIYAREAKSKDVKTTGAVSETAKKTPKNIQIALRKAGFYKGPIDGKIGEETKRAIREFQKSNGLSADGIVGRKTWSKLRKYL